MPIKEQFSAYGFILLASICYGSLGVAAKLAYADGVGHSALPVFQMFFGFLFFAILNIKNIGSFFSVSQKKILQLSLAGFLSGLTAYLYYSSLSNLTASTAVILLFQFVWIGVALEAIYERRWLSRYEVAAILLCYAGTYLGVGGVGGELHIRSVIEGFLSGAAFAGYIFISSFVCTDESSETRTFWIIFSAFIATLAFSFGGIFETAVYPTIFWGSLCGVLGVLIPFYIYSAYSPKIGSAATSLVGSTELPAALVISWAFLGEELDGLQVLGAVIVMSGVALIFVAAKAK